MSTSMSPTASPEDLERQNQHLESLRNSVHQLQLHGCACCKKGPVLPVYSCLNGHLVCSECRLRYRKCEICDEGFSFGRDFELMNIVNASEFNCKFKVRGCDEEINGKFIADHLEICKFRSTVSCYEIKSHSCNGESVYLNQYFFHLKDVHKAEGQIGESLTFYGLYQCADKLNSDETFTLDYLFYDGKHFLISWFIENQVMYWWVSVIGSENDAEKYWVKLILQKFGGIPEIQWDFPVHAPGKSRDEVKKTGIYGAVSTKQAAKMSIPGYRDKRGKSWRFTWKILCIMSLSHINNDV